MSQPTLPILSLMAHSRLRMFGQADTSSASTVKIRGGSTCYQDSLSFHGATPFRIRPGQEVSGLALTLATTAARHVSGQVPVEVLSTTPRVKFRAVVLPGQYQIGVEQDFSAEQAVGADGKFHFNLLNPGKYRLYAFEDFDREAWGNPQLAVLLASKSLEVEIKEGESSACNCAAYFN